MNEAEGRRIVIETTKVFIKEWCRKYPNGEKAFNLNGDLQPYLIANIKEIKHLLNNMLSYTVAIKDCLKDGIIEEIKIIPKNYDNSSEGRRQRIVKHYRVPNHTKDIENLEDLVWKKRMERDIGDMKDTLDNFLTTIFKKKKEVKNNERKD